MKVKLMKNLILLIIMVMICFSCTNDVRREVIKGEVGSAIAENNNIEEDYKYIINTRTGKVHTYSDGINTKI